MALGGGTFTTQNKELPGTYINFVSASAASAALSERGIATMPLELDWGIDGEIFEVTNADFQKNSLKLFGYDYTHEKLKGLRDLFLNARTVYVYKLTSGGEKATNTYATAKYGGERGNSIKIAIQKNVDDDTYYDVQTIIDNTIVDVQTVKTKEELVANDFVTFNGGLTLGEVTATALASGTNKEVTGTEHQAYLDKIEAYTYNTMGVVTDEDAIKTLYITFNKRLRDEEGIKFQLVVQGKAADYYGVINVKNAVKDEGAKKSSMVYWVTGASAGCAINRSLQNAVYNGEFTPDTDLTQTALKQAIKAGEFTFHKVGSEIRVLEDVDSMVTTSDTQGDIFRDNQTIRVIDQIANDIATIFTTKYLGVVPNDNAGRISLWSDIVKHHEQLEEIRAIEDFEDSDVTVEQGNTKKSVVVNDAITVVNAMSKLYMTVTVA